MDMSEELDQVARCQLPQLKLVKSPGPTEGFSELAGNQPQLHKGELLSFKQRAK
jgi:hypothetical protein